MGRYTNYSARKSKWKRRVRKIDVRVGQFINDIKRGDPNITVTDYKEVGARILYLGEHGEALLDEAVELGMLDKVIFEIRDIVNFLAELSDKMRHLAERKWGGKLRSFPIYEPACAPATELIKQSETVRQLEKLVKHA